MVHLEDVVFSVLKSQDREMLGFELLDQVQLRFDTWNVHLLSALVIFLCHRPTQ